MGAFWGGFAATAVAAVWLKKRDPVFKEHVGRSTLWDLGKLTFAFAVFWTYLFWSQYLVIWYGKLPWEQAWVNTRAGDPWGGLSLLVIVLCFVVPFAGLLGARPKKTPVILQTFATVVLAGLWLWHYMLIFPSLHHEGDGVFSIATPLIGLMFLGAFPDGGAVVPGDVPRRAVVAAAGGPRAVGGRGVGQVSDDSRSTRFRTS